MFVLAFETSSLVGGSAHNHRAQASIKSNQPSTSHHVPTPPPRSKNPKNVRSGIVSERKTFECLHKEFGAKILRDQEARWALTRDNQNQRSKNSTQQVQLSVLKQGSLIDL